MSYAARASLPRAAFGQRARVSARRSVAVKSAAVGPANIVKIAPYFKVPADGMDAAKGLTAEMAKMMEFGQEPECLNYCFSQSGDLIHCIELYKSGDAALNHLTRVGAPLKKMMELAPLDRIEIHGAPEELAKLKEAVKDLPVSMFEIYDAKQADPLANYNDPLEAYCKDNADADECRVYED